MRSTPDVVRSEEAKEVIILGCGPTSSECRYHCETWGVNGTYTFAKRLNKLFFTDEEIEVNSCWYDVPELLTLDPVCVFPVNYKRFQELGLKLEIFPMKEIYQKFPSFFFSNTIAYMLAYAIYHRYDTIYLYGIDMMSHSTYIQEKGGVEFWMGVALGQGIKIVNTRGSATGKCWNGKMYGHYGNLSDGEFESIFCESPENAPQESLCAPWEFIKVNTAARPGTDWVKDGDEYRPIKTEVRLDTQTVKEKAQIGIK